MKCLSFENAFKYVDEIWSFGCEMHWYRKVWELFTQKGLTSYNTLLEYYDVLILKATVVMMYGEFCHVTFDEPYYYDGLYNLVEDEIEPGDLAQLYG